jgi:Co/Zn/Cd efflux system component
LRLINDSHFSGRPGKPTSSFVIHFDLVDGRIMSLIGVLGFFVNIVDAFILRWGSVDHGHSHSSKKTAKNHGILLHIFFIKKLQDMLMEM